eukprot:m.704790 g.704790  ORF g.704790 m.704790 type:complete len:568 (-) comp22921_c0_seq2:927-2630(-)
MASPGFALSTPHTGPQLIPQYTHLAAGGVRVRVNLPAFCSTCHKWTGQPFDRTSLNGLKTWVLADPHSSPRIKDLKERVLALHNAAIVHSGTFFLDSRSIFDHESTSILRENDELTLVLDNNSESNGTVCVCSTEVNGAIRERKRTKPLSQSSVRKRKRTLRKDSHPTADTAAASADGSDSDNSSSSNENSKSDSSRDDTSGDESSKMRQTSDSDNDSSENSSTDSSGDSSDDSSESVASTAPSSSSGSESSSESDSSSSSESDNTVSDSEKRTADEAVNGGTSLTNVTAQKSTELHSANKRTRRRRRRRRSRRGKKPESTIPSTESTSAPGAGTATSMCTTTPPINRIAPTAQTASSVSAKSTMRAIKSKDPSHTVGEGKGKKISHKESFTTGQKQEPIGPKAPVKNTVAATGTAADDNVSEPKKTQSARDPCKLMEVRVTKDFEQYPPVTMQSLGLVRVGCVLAFKQLVMSESYTPEVSDWKVGRVTHIFDPDTQTQGYIMTLATWCRGIQRPLGDGEGFGFRKFELEEAEEPEKIDFEGNDSSTLTINHSDMTDARAVSLTVTV